MKLGVGHSQALEAWRRSSPASVPPPERDPAALLAAHHPDHRSEGRTRLSIGANAGDECPVELASILQSDSIVEDVDIAGTAEREADVLVIGGGGAGCAAALTAADAGASVLLLTKLRIGDGNTVMAEGGIQAAVGVDDSLQRHFEDTVRGGHFAADRRLVATLVGDGPESIRWLIEQGVGFDVGRTDARGTELVRHHAGGSTAARVLSFRDTVGVELMRVLREAVLLHPRIVVADRSPAIELLTDASGRCTGAVLEDLRRGELCLARAGAVILATGGSGRLHLGGFPTSNHYGATADGLVMAYRLGARLVDLDSFQYHPTGLAWPSHLQGLLISEAARSRGARLVNGHGERFVDELAARDVVAAAILREIADGRGIQRDGAIGVWLDIPTLARERPGIVERELPTLVRLASRAGLDPTIEPLLVAPTLHYQNGGVAIDTEGTSGVEGLWCAGEVVGGIHGRNRLMGNALLELVVFGRRAGRAAAVSSRRTRPVASGLFHLPGWRRSLSEAGLPRASAPTLFPTVARTVGG